MQLNLLENNNYKYKGIELTPAVFADLLIFLLDGTQFDRQTATERVTTFHLENGGLLGKNNYVAVFKKATKYLKNKGMENVGYGMWRINYRNSKDEIVMLEKTHASRKFKFDKEIGSGDKAVYVYYYDKYKQFAELRGDDR